MSELMDKEKGLIDRCLIYLEQLEKSPSHGITHVKKVMQYGLQLSEEYCSDRKVIIIASLLHDVSRHFGYLGESHGRESVKLIQDFLDKLDLTPEQKEKTEHAIINHSLDEQEPVILIESRIIYDADKLSGFGLLGLIRICMFAGERGKDLDYIRKKMFIDMPKRVQNLHLDKSKAIADGLNKSIGGMVKEIF